MPFGASLVLLVSPTLCVSWDKLYYNLLRKLYYQPISLVQVICFVGFSPKFVFFIWMNHCSKWLGLWIVKCMTLVMLSVIYETWHQYYVTFWQMKENNCDLCTYNLAKFLLVLLGLSIVGNYGLPSCLSNFEAHTCLPAARARNIPKSSENSREPKL